MYERCVGEGGMSPEHFAHTLSLYESIAFLRGLDRRYYAAWAQARYTAFYAAAPHCNEKFTFEKMGKFSWEERDAAPHCNAEDEKRKLDALRERADMYDNGIIN